MSKLLAKHVFLTKGVGRHKEKLTSFENALRSARIAPYNLVRVSSIFPPGCKIIPRAEGLKKTTAGEVLFIVMSENATNEPNRLISASVGAALPKDKQAYGYLSEHHSFGQTEKVSGDYAEDLAAEMLASTRGIDSEENLEWDSRRGLWRLKKQIVTTRHVCQSAIGHKNGLWTTVIAAAVLLMD